ncbi:MAG: C39 family peptidase [Verrucomicrobiota bacterium JB023]|nr:C39 family peptidase [Verrucomicrobiota bacterium JB023]
MFRFPALLSLLTCGSLLADLKLPEPLALDDLLYSDSLWETPMEEIMKKKGLPGKEVEASSSLPLSTLRRMEERGMDISDYVVEVPRFQWLSSAKRGLRATRGGYSLNSLELGETVIRGDASGVKSVTISIYNRGDDELIGPTSYEARLKDWKTRLDAALQVRSTYRNQGGALPITGWMWKNGDSAYLLEGSINRREKRAEFIRLRIAPSRPLGAVSKKRTTRRDLPDNVQKNEEGDVWLKGVPMVDQGDKGYCVVASVERVLRYYGRQVDQHEMALLADTSAGGGTSTEDMKDAFRSITGKTNVKTIKLFEFDDNDLKKDIRQYNQLARKKEEKTIDIDVDDYYYLPPSLIWSRIDPVLFRTMKAEQNGFSTFNRKIQEYIDQGVPINWTLTLGLFKEGDLPQSYGGHMRLIIGYNKATGEIIYTDSWGEGHERKKMRADEAYCMTMGLYAMVPTR